MVRRQEDSHLLPNILRNFMKKNGMNTDIHVITGSVEISPGIGLAG